jgi:hypothetical protein
LSNSEKNQEIAAAKAGMDPQTTRKYLWDMPAEIGPAWRLVLCQTPKASEIETDAS